MLVPVRKQSAGDGGGGGWTIKRLLFVIHFLRE